MTSKTTDTRFLLLSAATNILMEGESVLTLDAVSKRSGISKGGLIHHFPTKEALIEGVVEQLIGQFTANAGRIHGVDDGGALEHVPSYVEGSLEPAMRETAADLARGLIRLCGSDFRKHAPFLDPWRRLFAKRLDRHRQSGDLEGFAKAAVVTLAIESFLLIDVFHLYEFTDLELDQIKTELITAFGK